jgi:hypothetical protein
MVFATVAYDRDGTPLDGVINVGSPVRGLPRHGDEGEAWTHLPGIARHPTDLHAEIPVHGARFDPFK